MDEFEGLSLVELIGLLNEVPEPPAISLMPQTGGWVVLGGLLICLAGSGLWRLARQRRANAYRRAALRALDIGQDDPAVTADILRRTALSAYPRARIVGLTGAEWLAFLDRSFPGQGFVDGPGQILAEAPYKPMPRDPAATELARDWIARHRVEGAH